MSAEATPNAAAPSDATSAAPAFEYPAPGSAYAERFEILEVIGSEAGGKVFRARDSAGGQVVGLWVLPPEVAAEVDIEGIDSDLTTLGDFAHKNLVRVHGWQRHAGGLYVWMEYVSGQRLSDFVRKKRRVSSAANFSLKGAYNLVAHLLGLLGKLPDGVFHGSLSPESVLLDGRGRVRLLGLGVSRHLPAGEAVLAHRAPDATLDRRSDLYSLGSILTELVAGSTGEQGVAALPGPVRAVAAWALQADPEDRPPDATALRRKLAEALQAANVPNKPTATPRPSTARATPRPRPLGAAASGTPPPPGAVRSSPSLPSAAPAVVPDRPVGKRLSGSALRARTEMLSSPAPQPKPTPTPKQQKRASLFKRALEGLRAPSKQEATWLAHRDGFDYGPFTVDELIDRVRKEEFDESTIVQDLGSGERKPLLEFDTFKGPLERLVRERQAKLQERAAVRSSQVRTAKKAGRGLTLAIVLGVGSFLTVSLYLFLRAPTPKPFVAADVLAGLGRPVQLPKLEPATAIAARIKEKRKREATARARARRKARDAYVPSEARTLGAGGGVDGPQKVDFTSDDSGGGGRPLSNAEVDRTVRAHWGRLSRCIAMEVKRNPNLREAVLMFRVGGDGRTKSFQVRSNGTQKMFRCLRTEISAMRFRAHGGPPRKVVYPLSVSR